MLNPLTADDSAENDSCSAILPPAVRQDMAAALLDWFARNRRPLPWRRSYEPYEVWLSEIMLQQTQMERGRQYFERWVQRFPNIQSIADAPLDDLLKCWEGLGYYSRVRNLQKAAQLIMERHEGRIPSDHSSLFALPGIGEYTAGAILSIAFNRPVPAVDTNVERVFARLFDIDAPVKSAIAYDYIRQMAAALIPEGRARDFNQALMELGALVCSRKPACGVCPLAGFCQSRQLGIATERPVPGKKVSCSALEIISGVLICNGRIFLQKRLDSGVWAGLWEFPGGRLEKDESPEQGIVREFFEETEFRVRVVKSLGVIRHAYTRYRIRMYCFLLALESEEDCRGDFGGCEGGENNPSGTDINAEPAVLLSAGAMPRPELHAATEYRWLTPVELEEGSYTLPAGHRKLLSAWSAELREAALCGIT